MREGGLGPQSEQHRSSNLWLAMLCLGWIHKPSITHHQAETKSYRLTLFRQAQPKKNGFWTRPLQDTQWWMHSCDVLAVCVGNGAKLTDSMFLTVSFGFVLHWWLQGCPQSLICDVDGSSWWRLHCKDTAHWDIQTQIYGWFLWAANDLPDGYFGMLFCKASDSHEHMRYPHLAGGVWRNFTWFVVLFDVYFVVMGLCDAHGWWLLYATLLWWSTLPFWHTMDMNGWQVWHYICEVVCCGSNTSRILCWWQNCSRLLVFLTRLLCTYKFTSPG